MNRHYGLGLVVSLFAILTSPTLWADGETAPARDPKQPIDEAYTAKIQKYTTAPYFTSPLVNYLPASKNVPTPEAVLPASRRKQASPPGSARLPRKS